jgi:phenylpyruvate tautomerase PptA (4-oxalocrotonate tautomerase family)
MPFLQITTNTEADDATLAQEASVFAADILGKPESYVMVHIQSNATLVFAGGDAPCAHIKLKSLGLPEQHTAAFSERLCAFVQEKLGIEPGRIYIEFAAPERHMWGWDKRTF